MDLTSDDVLPNLTHAKLVEKLEFYESHYGKVDLARVEGISEHKGRLDYRTHVELMETVRQTKLEISRASKQHEHLKDKIRFPGSRLILRLYPKFKAKLLSGQRDLILGTLLAFEKPWVNALNVSYEMMCTRMFANL